MSHTVSETCRNLTFAVDLGARGRLVLPAPIRKRLNLHDGDRLVVTMLADGTVQLTSLAKQVEKLGEAFPDLAPGRSLADELIAERRDEARRETEE